MIDINIYLNRPGFNLLIDTRIDQPVTGIFGPSGAGKTTLLNTLLGLEPKATGRIVLDGDVLFDTTAQTNTPCHQRGIAAVFQDGRLLPHYTVAGNLRYGTHKKQPKPGQAKAITFDSAVEILRLGHLLERKPATLSGGERQRVAIGRALLTHPRLLVLDEPVSSLDHTRRREILTLLQTLRDETGTRMIYVSHELGETLSLTDQLVILENGKLIGHGSYHDLSHNQHTLPALLSNGNGLLNVLKMQITGDDPERGCLKLHSLNQPASQPLQLWAPRHASTLSNEPDAPPQAGSYVTATIRAEDIALASNPIEATSIQNQVRAKVTRITERNGLVIVEANAGAPLLIEVSTGSQKRLGLTEGAEVICLIKAQAIHIEHATQLPPPQTPQATTQAGPNV